MSKCMPKDEAFIARCKTAASKALTVWANDIRVWYDANPEHPYWTKRDYCLQATHCWGTIQCYWDKETKEELFKLLRDAGATRIIGSVRWNRVDIAFDRKVRCNAGT